MDFCTTVLIDWVKVQKRHAGQEMESGAFPHFVHLPRGFGGVWISDDDCTILPPNLYREFVVPYNSRVFQAFGGGSLHYCGSAGHQLENFAATDGLTAVNVWCMSDFGQIFRAQEIFGDRITITVDDFAPLDIAGYYAGLFAGLRLRGVVLASFPSATFATVGRRTEDHRRDPTAVGSEALKVIRRHVRARQGAPSEE